VRPDVAVLDAGVDAVAALAETTPSARLLLLTAGDADEDVLRGLLRPGMAVSTGMKIGDIDPRGDPRFCQMVSDKSLAVGGGVLEAILSRPDLRPFLWD